MPLKTPEFWKHKDGLAQWLRPLSCLYLACHRLKMICAKPYKSSVPVVCVGGAVAGGSGKTPVVHAILNLIREENLFENPVILTRGYGGKLKGPTLVDLSAHSAVDVGDEAMLHAMHAPTIVSRNRMQGALLAAAMDADIVLMDDGLQNNSLAKDFTILVLDKDYGTGNGYVIPAGPLREPLEDVIARSDIQVHTGSPVVVSTHDKGKSYFAFAGLGHPEKFKNTLLQNGFALSGFESFADHHPYSDKDILRLKEQAGGATLVTTEKDFVKISPLLQENIEVLRIAHVLEDREKISARLKGLRQR